MMRKFPKLLAVVLAIAIIICPAMCLTSMAESANGYDINYDAATSTVTVNVTADAPGFLVALLRLNVKGFDVETDQEGELVVNVATDAGVDFSANPDFTDGVLSLLLASKTPESTALATTATVTFKAFLKDDAGEDYGITLTTIQAADAGSAEGGVLVAEKFLSFPNVADAENGAIDVEAAGDNAVAIKPCTHSNTTPDPNNKPASCTEDGLNRVICSDCGKVMVDEILKATGHTYAYVDLEDGVNHLVVCDKGDLESEQPHVDEDANSVCDLCNGALKTEEPECQHENATYVVTTAPTKDTEGSKTYTCECGDTWTEVIPAITEYNAAITTTYSGGLKATPYMTFSFTKTEISSDFTNCTDLKLVVTRYNNGGNYNFGTLVTDIVEYSSTSSKIIYYYYNVELYSLTVPIKAVLYYTDPNGNFCRSDEFTTTFNENLKGLYDKAVNNNNAKLQTTIVDVVKAGSAVQTFVTDKKDACDYATKVKLPDDPTLGVWSEDALAKATAELGTLRSYFKDGSANGITIGKSAGVNSNGYLAFSIKGIAAADRANYAVKLSYYNAIIKDDAIKTRSLDVAMDDLNNSGSTIWAYIRDLPMVSTNAEVKVEVYNVADPETILASYNYCFEDFINEKAIQDGSNVKLSNALIALGKLGKSFRANNNIDD